MKKVVKISELNSIKNEEVKYINLLREDLKYFNVKNYNNLVYLNLNCTNTEHISYIPDTVKYLNLSVNNIKFIENIPSSLEYLNMETNELEKFDFDLPENLRTLNISWNLIINFNVKLNNKLVTLNLEGNRLEEVKLDFPDSLKYLRISNNKLKSFDVKLPPNLVELDLAFNRIKKFNCNILNNKIKILNLVSNKLRIFKYTNVPDSLKLIKLCSDRGLLCVKINKRNIFYNLQEFYPKKRYQDLAKHKNYLCVDMPIHPRYNSFSIKQNIKILQKKYFYKDIGSTNIEEEFVN